MSHVIVTGGSSGIGLAIAREYLDQGCVVTLVASRADPMRIARAELAEQCGIDEARIGTVACDVRDAAALTSALAGAEADKGPCDILVTSAGVARPGRFEALPSEEFRRQMDVNFFGTVNAVRAVLPGMIARRKGRIGMISSAAGLLGIFGHTAYAPTKFAVRGFAEALRCEVRPHGISVSVCYPPDTDTPQLAAEAKRKPPETAAIAGQSRIWQPEDVARLTLDGIARGKFAIYPGLEIGALARLGGLLAPVLNWHFDRVIARVQRDRTD